MLVLLASIYGSFVHKGYIHLHEKESENKEIINAN